MSEGKDQAEAQAKYMEPSISSENQKVGYVTLLFILIQSPEE